MATKMLYASVFLSLLTAAAINPLTQGTNHTRLPSQVVHQKLQDALLADSTTLYLMQKVFFPLQGLPPHLVSMFVCVTVGSTPPDEYCDQLSSLSGASHNFSYYSQQFQWSSSSLVFLISFDQLVVLDNVISTTIYRFSVSPHYNLTIQLHIDSLPSDISEDDLLEGLLQLLTWVRSICTVAANDLPYVSHDLAVDDIDRYSFIDTQSQFMLH